MWSKLARRMDLLVFIFFQIIILRFCDAVLNVFSLLSKKYCLIRSPFRIPTVLSLSLLLVLVL